MFFYIVESKPQMHSPLFLVVKASNLNVVNFTYNAVKPAYQFSRPGLFGQHDERRSWTIQADHNLQRTLQQEHPGHAPWHRNKWLFVFVHIWSHSEWSVFELPSGWMKILALQCRQNVWSKGKVLKRVWYNISRSSWVFKIDGKLAGCSFFLLP